MKRKQRTWRTAALCLLLCLGLMRTAAQASYPYPAITDRETPCSLTLDMGAPGVTVRVYRAAEVTEDVRFVLTGDFAGYNVDLDGLTSTGWASLAQTLRGYVFLDAIQPLRTGVSDETGRLTFSDLPVGLYLVDGERIASTEDNGYRQPAPFMICLPNWEQSTDPETGTVSGGWQYNVAARPKYTTLDGDVVMRRVLKVWNDGGSISRPAQISVTLLKDGEPYETVDLNAENNWRYAWDELDGNSDWQIVESSGSGGYTVSVSLQGVTFVVTNSYNPPPPVTPPPVNPPGDPPDGTSDNPPDTPNAPPPVPPPPDEVLEDPEVPLASQEPEPEMEEPVEPEDPDEIVLEDPEVPLASLPQTGQLWWPVPMLAMGGMISLLLGLIRNRRSQDDEG